MWYAMAAKIRVLGVWYLYLFINFVCSLLRFHSKDTDTFHWFLIAFIFLDWTTFNSNCFPLLHFCRTHLPLGRAVLGKTAKDGVEWAAKDEALGGTAKEAWGGMAKEDVLLTAKDEVLAARGM